MNVRTLLFSALLMCGAGVSGAAADCQISDARLEEAIQKNPELRGSLNRALVHDLRRLRDAALILRSFGRHDDCERLVANIRELLAAPSIGALGDSDEGEAEKQALAREPRTAQGKAAGQRAAADAKPLSNFQELTPGLRADEVIGSEVRSSDDRIIGEVRNIVLASPEHPGYAVVASGGFFVAGNASIVVPLSSLQVSADRDSYYLSIDEAAAKAVPPMPDQEYGWLSDSAWWMRNDGLFSNR